MNSPVVPSHGPSETALALTVISMGLGKIVEFLVSAEPVLESLSYMVAIIAGVVTIYYKFKHRK